MALMITDECINCDVCGECPNGAISMDIYVIDPNKCTECVGHFDEPQCQQVSGRRIPRDPQHDESHAQLMEKYHALTAERATTRRDR